MLFFRYLILLLFLQAASAAAQTNPDSVKDTAGNTHGHALDEFVLSYNKFSERSAYVAQPVGLLKRREMEWAAPQNTGSLLEQTGQVFLQRSQQGGGSPVIRGFEASRILMVVDGVRMNNAIYRAGHLQNVITIDNNILDRVEILYGPGSTLYGSDALGGVISFTTRAPQLSSGTTKGLKVSGQAMLRTATACEEQTIHADVNIGGKRFASFTSATYSSFGDLRQGAARSASLDSFGKRYTYVDRGINGEDVVVTNPDPNVQRGSAYSQYDLAQKFLFKPSARVTHALNFQLSNSSDVPRYDRLTEQRNRQPRYAAWYYGPQFRALGAYNLTVSELGGFFDGLIAGVNYQGIEESRFQRTLGSANLQGRIESVDVLGYNIDLRKGGGRHELTVGTDGQMNWVASEAQQTGAAGGEPISTRYPDGGSKMFYGAVYAQHLWKIIPRKLILNDGLRFNYTSLRAKFIDKTFFPLPYNEAAQQHTGFSGNLGLVYFPAKRWRIASSLATGFRAPNIDDLVKVFESAGGANLLVPNADLKPEKTYTLDLHVNYTVTGVLSIEAGGFVTRFSDAIAVAPYRFNGADSLLYDGKMTAVAAAQNGARANLRGAYGSMTLTPLPGLSLYSTVTYTFGRYYDAQQRESPLDHIPPVYGKTSLAYAKGIFSSELFAMYNGWKHLKDYSPSGEDNLPYATRLGMPSWVTLNARVGVQLSKCFFAQASLENIFDKNYRTFASGISSPGRNLVLTLRAKL